jgi:hypothetical protein
MSVEYALMLVLIMGVLTTGIGLALQSRLQDFVTCLQGELTGAGCTGSTLPSLPSTSDDPGQPETPNYVDCQSPSPSPSPSTPESGGQPAPTQSPSGCDAPDGGS